MGIVCTSGLIFLGNAGRANTLNRDEIDRRVNIILEEYENPGIEIGIVLDGKLAFNQSYSLAHPKPDKPKRKRALFQIASVTKTFVGTLAAILWQEGRVDLDKPVTHYDPKLVFHNSIDSRHITLRRLLTHTSGLPQNAPNRVNITPPTELPDGYDPTISEPYSRKELYQAVAEARPVFKPSENHQYCNFCFHIAGHILAEAAGYKSLAEALEDKIFKPLGMDDSKIPLSGVDRKRLAPAYVYIRHAELYGGDSPKQKNYRVPHWKMGEVVGGWGVTSDVQDLSKFLAYMSMPEQSAKELLTPAAMDVLLRVDHQYLRRGRTPFDQSLGWRSNIFGEYGRVYRHTGHNDGHHAFVAFSKEHMVGVVILASGSFEGMDLLGNRLLLYALRHKASGVHAPLIPSL